MNKDICTELWKFLETVDFRFVSNAFNQGFLQSRDVKTYAICNTEEELKCVSNLYNLYTLQLSNGEITNSWLQYISKIRHLQILAIDQSCDIDKKLSGELFKCISKLSCLHAFYLAPFICHSVTDDSLRFFSNLKWLDIYYSLVTDEGLKHISNVETLYLHACKITGDGLKYLSNLKHIHLSCSRLTNDSLKYLQNVYTINIGGYSNITYDGMKYLKNVQEVSLTTNNITDEWLKYFENLKSINLCECYDVTDVGMKYLSKNKHLQEVDLSYDVNITDEGLSHLSESICVLKLSHCEISDKSIEKFKNLRILDISSCDNVTGEGLKNLKFLEEVDVDCCEQIREDVVNDLKLRGISVKNYLVEYE